MAASSKSVSLSGNPDIDALLSGSQWNTGNLTFSFPTSASFYNYSSEPYNEAAHSFQALTPALQSAAQMAFSTYSQYANVSFTKVTETSSTHADIRLAMATPLQNNALGIGYFPGDAAVKSGDVWLDAASLQPDPGGTWTDLTPGSSGYLDLMHEIGHALGLQHPGLTLPDSHAGWDYTIMIYQQFSGAQPPFIGDNPQTPMMDDIAALQYMYGANFNTNSGDTTYSWSPKTGEMFINGVGQGTPDQNYIYMTLWDGGGIDTYDFSNYKTDVHADLRPGQWSSPSFTPNVLATNQVASLDFPDVWASGSIANALLYNGDTRSLIENAIGGSGNDTLIGNQGNNILTGNSGDDTFFYTGGIDTFFGGAKGTKGDTADFSLSSVGVAITPVESTLTTVLPNGQTITLIVSDTSSLADTAGNSYDASFVSDFLGLVHLVDMHGIENITGSPFADTISGNLGDNVINAGDGNDHVYYTGGFDTLDGGHGIDTVDFSQFGSAVKISLSAVFGAPPFFLALPEVYTSDTTSILPDTLQGIANLAGFENAIGTPFDDSIVGNSGNNTLDGSAGNDTLFYDGGGKDVLNGNTGTDTADFSLMTSAVFVDLTAGGFEAKSNGTINANTGNLFDIADLQSIENLNGTPFSDVLRGDGNPNHIDGGAGNDILDGGFGNDTLIGGLGANTVSYVSHDTSTLITGEVNTISLGINGADGSFIRSELSRSGSVVAEADVLRGIENVVGSNRPETITGNEQDNTIAGRGGSDTINGGAGNDTYDFTGPTGLAVGNDQLFDQSGTADRVLINSLSNITGAARSGNDLVVTLVNGSFKVVDHFNGHPIESLVTLDGFSVTLSTSNIGGNGSGIIAGGNGGETLDGRGGDDFLFGGNGSDRLIGGDGNDKLTGGNGADTFVFGPGFGHDVVTDFAPADHIQFDAGVFQNVQQVLAASQEVGGNTVITVDANNTVTLQDVALQSLHAKDFIIG